MPRGLNLASSCWRMSALSRSVRPPPKQLLSYFRSRRRRPAPQCPEATRRHLWEAAGGNGDLAKPRGEAESTAPPTGGQCWSGQRPVTKAVNGTRRLGVLFGSSQEGPGGTPPHPPPAGGAAGGAVGTEPRPAAPGSAWWVTRPAVSGADLPQPRRAPRSLLVLNLTRTHGRPSVPCAPCPSSSRFRHVSDASAGGEARGRLGGSALHAAQGRARDACFPKAARTPLLGGGTLLSLEP